MRHSRTEGERVLHLLTYLIHLSTRPILTRGTTLWSDRIGREVNGTGNLWERRVSLSLSSFNDWWMGRAKGRETNHVRRVFLSYVSIFASFLPLLTPCHWDRRDTSWEAKIMTPYNRIPTRFACDAPRPLRERWDRKRECCTPSVSRRRSRWSLGKERVLSLSGHFVSSVSKTRSLSLSMFTRMSVLFSHTIHVKLEDRQAMSII